MEALSRKQGRLKRDTPAVVLGLFETGLGVGRSLGRNGIRVFGFDEKIDIGFYSKFINAATCPSPLREADNFIHFLLEFGKKQKRKSALFVTADYFLNAISRNRMLLKEHYLFNIPNQHIIEAVSDKFKQTQIASDAGIFVPKTFLPENLEEACSVADLISFPAFIKGQQVNQWRSKFPQKGFFVNTKDELIQHYKYILSNKVTAIVQEVIQGPDTNNYKVCTYTSEKGEILLAFTLQKMRQKPAEFGVGSCVKSIHYPELLDTGLRFFRNIGYTGVGSAEFKVNEIDGNFYLIELNQRYWQQNALAEKCGMNFPLLDYLYVTGQNPGPSSHFREDFKWVNLYVDWTSYREYWKRGELSFAGWVKSLGGPKVFSDFALDDLKPACNRFLKKMKNELAKSKKRLGIRAKDEDPRKYLGVPQKHRL